MHVMRYFNNLFYEFYVLFYTKEKNKSKKNFFYGLINNINKKNANVMLGLFVCLFIYIFATVFEALDEDIILFVIFCFYKC